MYLHTYTYITSKRLDTVSPSSLEIAPVRWVFCLPRSTDAFTWHLRDSATIKAKAVKARGKHRSSSFVESAWQLNSFSLMSYQCKQRESWVKTFGELPNLKLQQEEHETGTRAISPFTARAASGQLAFMGKRPFTLGNG